MEIFSGSIRSLWGEWELRVLVLVSLLWQIILIILGNKRKYIKSGFIRFIVWVMYLSADWLATVSLGNLASNQGKNADLSTSKSKSESKKLLLQALWAPFLLLHLGGPDTITAYALEDNSLWLRHLLGLVVQVIVAFYIFILSWGNNINALTFIAIPVFMSGIIKYSERTCALRAASLDHFHNSSFSSALSMSSLDLEHIRGDIEVVCVHKGYLLFPLLKRLYANLSLTIREGRRSYSLLVKKDGREHIGMDVFKVVEVQLGFLFDILYTKATIIYKPLGLILRLISVLSIVSALVAFTFVIDSTYSRVEVAITFTLFIGAVSLEIYAFASLVLSDWTVLWLTKRDSGLAHFAYSSISLCRSILPHKKRWSGYMGQLNLVGFCMKETTLLSANMFRTIYFDFSLRWRMRLVKVDDDLKSLILAELEKFTKNHHNYSSYTRTARVVKELLSHRGNKMAKTYGGMIGRSCEVEFDHSILLWHVATDICYHHSDFGEDKIVNQEAKKREASKKISDYLLYILLMRPSMLPTCIDMSTHVKDTLNHAIRLFHQQGVKTAENASRRLMHQAEVFDVGEQRKSVLYEVCGLASELKDIGENNKDKVWEVIWGVWLEMLTYAAGNCEWRSHAQQLRDGGEFLTHVSLLMADLGLSEHSLNPNNF